ncbi:MAG: mitochondrial fission ELM1 family protein [Litorimonas sp.]
MKILVVSDGRRGIENQARGLADAVARHSGVACEITTYTLTHRPGFAALPPSLQLTVRRNFDLPDADLVIGCGRQAVAPLIALRRSSRSAFTVYVQHPRTDPSRFDLVVAPDHDGLTGSHVETMIGSPNRVTRDMIISGTLTHGARLSTLPMPRAMIAIGGPSKTHTMRDATIQSHLEAARGLTQKGYSLLVTTSRRTPDAARKAWQAFAQTQANIWLHTPESDADNPYFAFLGGADILLVTEDSTNMLTEACTTGKPVYRLAMDGDPGKFRALYEALETRCHVRRWNGNFEARPYPALDETNRMAQRIIERMAARD